MKDEKCPAVYILASRRNGTLYTGVTSALWNRVAAHKDGSIFGFTRKHGVKLLVCYEHHHTMESAITRETRIKGWRRDWKLQLIEKSNPDWRDLHDEIDVASTLVNSECETSLRTDATRPIRNPDDTEGD